MAYLLNTTILARLANVGDAQHSIAAQAVLDLHRRGEVLHITPQVMIEFRNVATRPQAVNGLGLTSSDSAKLAAMFETRFPLLADTADVYPVWQALVDALNVIGKQVHDARLVAICHVHGVTHVLTFNVGHFTRLASFAPGIVVVDPANV